MKKIGILFATMVFLLLTIGNINAQNKNKAVYTGSDPWDGVLDCTDDYVTGVESYVLTVWGRNTSGDMKVIILANRGNITPGV